MSRLFHLSPALLLLSSCIVVVDGQGDWSRNLVPGSGVEVSEGREFEGTFERVHVGASVDVEIRVGEAQSVTVRADDNLIEWIDTSVRDGVLRIGWDSPDGSGWRPKVKPRVDVTVPALTGVELEGAPEVRVRGVRSSSFDVEVAGAGRLRADGKVETLKVDVAGAGDVDLFDLETTDAEVEVSGAGDVDLRATGHVRATVSGAGDVRVKGGAVIEQHVNGAGSVRSAGL
jgi:hypothetical protein